MNQTKLVRGILSGLHAAIRPHRLASDFPLWHEIVGALGEYVDPEDADAIGEGMDRLLSADPDTQFARSVAAGKRIAEHFTWESESVKLEALYERLQPPDSAPGHG